MNQLFDELITQRQSKWLENVKLPDVISELGKRVAFFLDLFLAGLHHADEKQLKKMDWKNNHFIEFIYSKDLATYDFDALTKIVLLSHDLKLRVEINACNFGKLKLIFHSRENRGFETPMHSRMPFLEDHILSLRNYYGFELPKESSRSNRSSSPLSLEQAVAILNAGKYQTKETAGKDVIWKIENEDQITAILNKNTEIPQKEDYIRRSTAIHRARQLIRRCPPISAFREQIDAILKGENLTIVNISAE